MASEQHTPGPWHDKADHGEWTADHESSSISSTMAVADEYGTVVALATNVGDWDDEELAANARLIAAAPDGYAAAGLTLDALRALRDKSPDAITQELATAWDALKAFRAIPQPNRHRWR